ncbi:hypothetical protein X942_6604 [Burkholderia pseudomallei MSHR5596]|nr:hypothetical protein X942_6604 [Burkholderia pseudomallei MSHR5596]
MRRLRRGIQNQLVARVQVEATGLHIGRGEIHVACRVERRQTAALQRTERVVDLLALKRERRVRLHGPAVREDLRVLQIDIASRDQRPVRVLLIGLRQIHDRHQYLLAADRLGLHDDHVGRERGHLLRRQAHAERQVQRLRQFGAREHQRLIHALEVRIRPQYRLARQLRDLVAHELLLVEPVTEALFCRQRVDADLVQVIVARQEIVHPRERGVRLDQVRRVRCRVRSVQAALRNRQVAQHVHGRRARDHRIDPGGRAALDRGGSRLRTARVAADRADRQPRHGLAGQQAERRNGRIGRRVVHAHAVARDRAVRAPRRAIVGQAVLPHIGRRGLRIAAWSADERLVAERQGPVVFRVVVVVVVVVAGIHDRHARRLLTRRAPAVHVEARGLLDVAGRRHTAPVVLECLDRRRVEIAARCDLRARAQLRHGVGGRLALIGRVLIPAVPLATVRWNGEDPARLQFERGNDRRGIVIGVVRIVEQVDPVHVLTTTGRNVVGGAPGHADAELLQQCRIDLARVARGLHHAPRVRDLVGVQFHRSARLDRRRRIVDQRCVRIVAVRVLAARQSHFAKPEDRRGRHRIAQRRVVAVLDVVRDDFQQARRVRCADQRDRAEVRHRAARLDGDAAADHRAIVRQVARMRTEQAACRHRARVDNVAGVDRQVMDRLQVRAVGERARQGKRQVATNVELRLRRRREVALQINRRVTRRAVCAAAEQRGSRYRQVARRGDRPVGIRHRARHRDVHVARGVRDVADLSSGVVQRSALNQQVRAHQLAALRVRDRGRTDCHVALAGHLPHAVDAARVAVHDLTAALHGHLARAEVVHRAIGVVDRSGLNRQRARVAGRARLDVPLVVRQCPVADDRQRRVRAHQTLSIVHRPGDRGRQTQFGGDDPTTIVQTAGLHDGLSVGADRAASILQGSRAVAGRERQRAGPTVRDGAFRVVQNGRRERQVRAVRLDDAAVRIVERARDGECGRAALPLRDVAALVFQVRGRQRKLIGFEVAVLAVVEQASNGCRQSGGDDLAVQIRERGAMNRRRCRL